TAGSRMPPMSSATVERLRLCSRSCKAISSRMKKWLGSADCSTRRPDEYPQSTPSRRETKSEYPAWFAVAISSSVEATPMLVWFAETTIVAAVLAALAIAAGKLRPIPPSARHALWLVVLIKFLTPPLVSWPWARSLEWPTAGNQARAAVVAPTEIPPSIVPVAHPCEPVLLSSDYREEDTPPAPSDECALVAHDPPSQERP